MTSERCSVRVYTGERYDFSGHMCARKASVQVDGKWFCGTHSPEAVAKRKAASDAKWDEQSKKRQAQWEIELYNRQAGDACRAMGIVNPLTEIPILVNGSKP